MNRDIMEQNILAKLTRGLDLTKAQVEYVKAEIEPKYTNDCLPCRFNAATGCGLTVEQAFKAQAVYEERHYS